LAPEHEDELRFGECPVGVSREISFTLHNHSAIPYRFEWKAHADFTFVPMLGHIQAKGSKDIKVTFRCAEPRQHKGAVISLKLAKIKYLTTTIVDWDDTVVLSPEIMQGTLLYNQFSPFFSYGTNSNRANFCTGLSCF
jgi:hypothetical protein